MFSLLYLRVKTQEYFENLSYMFLDEKTLPKIWFNLGLNLIIFRGTGPKWIIRLSINPTKKKTLVCFFVFLLSVPQVFQRSYYIFMQTRTCSYKPRSMLQPMPGRDKVLQNLNLISSKSQMFSIPHDVCFSCAWDSSFGKNDDDQGLFVGWFEIH